MTLPKTITNFSHPDMGLPRICLTKSEPPRGSPHTGFEPHLTWNHPLFEMTLAKHLPQPNQKRPCKITHANRYDATCNFPDPALPLPGPDLDLPGPDLDLPGTSLTLAARPEVCGETLSRRDPDGLGVARWLRSATGNGNPSTWRTHVEPPNVACCLLCSAANCIAPSRHSLACRAVCVETTASSKS